MGTLMNQPVRNNITVCAGEIDELIPNIIALSEEHKITIDQVIEIWKLVELTRKNDLYVANGDIRDEQIAGIGELIQEFNNNIEGLTETIVNKQ